MLRMDCVTFCAACGLRPPLYCFDRKNALASKHFCFMIEYKYGLKRIIKNKMHIAFGFWRRLWIFRV